MPGMGDAAAPAAVATLPLGASIVLFRTPAAEIEPLIRQLLDQGVQLLYLIDNSPGGFDAFAGWRPPERVVTISTRRNLGYGRGHNLAIRDSVRRHEYHLVCNPDISMEEQTLPTLYTLLEQQRDIGLCIPKVVGVDGELHHLCKLAPSPLDLAIRRFCPPAWFAARRAHFEMRDRSYDDEMEPPFMSGCFMFFRSSVLARLDGFDERFFLYLEDLDLSRRSQRIARNLYYPRRTIVHAHQRGAHKSLKLLLAFGVSVLRYFNKWGWFEQPWFPQVRRKTP
jgi:GT2 family glycosyltransferase